MVPRLDESCWWMGKKQIKVGSNPRCSESLNMSMAACAIVHEGIYVCCRVGSAQLQSGQTCEGEILDLKSIMRIRIANQAGMQKLHTPCA